jgi:hypothetical protein
MKKLNLVLQPFALAGLVSLASANIGYESLGFLSGDFENGANLSGTETTETRFGSPVTVRRSTFSASGGGMTANFDNEYIVEWGAWSGWAYSRDTDSTTAGFSNQYSARPGSGVGGSSNYGLAYTDTGLRFSEAEDFTGLGLYLANTTYAYFSMQDGDSFADPFTAGDYFKVTIEGFNGGISQGRVDHYLADFRSADPADHFISTAWDFVSLDSLGTVDELQFAFDVTDPGTPNYFAIDNIGAVPEPSAFALLAGVAALGVVAFRRCG